MAKGSGLGALLFVDEYDISGDTQQASIGRPSNVLDMTAINATGHERIHAAVDGQIQATVFFNDESVAGGGSTNQEHVALKAKASGADRIVSYFQGSAIGNMAACLACKQRNYDASRGEDGSLTIQAQGQDSTSKGLDYCEQLTAGKRTDTGATNGTGLQEPAGGTAFGLAAYLHVFSFSGTDATVKLQESSDDGDTDLYADVTGGGFTQVTGVTKERIVTGLTQAVEQYLRVVTITSGGFSNLVFAVAATRYPAA